MNRIRFAAVLTALSLGPASISHAQLGSAIRKKAAEAVKDAPKRDTVKVPAPEAARKPAASAPVGAPAVPVAQSATTKSDSKIWENYDFVPGNKVLFYTDFSEDRVGNFAHGMKYVSGPAEVVERDGIKVLRATGTVQFLVPVGRILPQRFTLEIDAIAPSAGALTRAVSFEGGAKWLAKAQSATVSWNPRAGFYEGSGRDISSSVSDVAS